MGIYKEKLYSNMPRINEISFDSDRKLMTTIHKIGDRYRVITKGAVDVLLNKCERIYIDGDIRNINQLNKDEVLSKNTNMADKALRVLGVAYKDLDRLPLKIDAENVENGFIFVRPCAE